jgi:oligopeptide/dipeptide ABC transporter ATP-binding protein
VEEILKAVNLKLYYPVKEKGSAKKKFVKAVDGVNFTVYKGETFGVVGESGCGKTTTGKTIVKLLTPTSGELLYKGRNIFELSKSEDLQLKKKIQIIFQDPFSSLDPRFTCARIIAEPMVVHKAAAREERRQKTLELLNDVGLRPDCYARFPHEFSGGQRQRIGVARALALNPELVVCDEPVSALDVSIQAQILNLMRSLQEKYRLTYIFISHNLSVVKHFCDRIAVMYLGNIVELAEKRELFVNHRHPYTAALLDAIPIPDPERKSMQNPLEGDIPSPLDPPSGCVFHTRCKYCADICKEEKPILKDIGSGHMAACHMV